MSLSVLPQAPSASLAYTYQNGRYVNLTSRCPTACTFCIKFSWQYQYRGYNLKLKNEPPIEEILAAVGSDLSQYSEVVFCGYGESTYRLKEMENLSHVFRQRKARQIRLNTIGLGNLIHGRNIAPELARFLDAVSISLNTVDPQQYVEIHRPLPEFRQKAFSSACDFVKFCREASIETTVTAVSGPGINTEKVKEFATRMGVAFRLRPYLEDYQPE